MEPEKAPGAAPLTPKALIWGCRLQRGHPPFGAHGPASLVLCCGTPRPQTDTEHSSTWTPGRKWPPGEKSPVGSSAQLCGESRPDVELSTGSWGLRFHRRCFHGPLVPGPSGARPPARGRPTRLRRQNRSGHSHCRSRPPRPRARSCRVLPASPSCPARVLGLPCHPDPYQLPVRDEPSPSPAQNSASHKPLWLPAARLPGRAESSAPPAGRRPFPTGKGGTCRRPGTEMAEPAFA